MGEPRAKRASPAEAEERRKAQDLATRTGVPLWGAFRVVRGETTLDQLLKSLLRREKFTRLQAKDGLDADLAGHVASGTLPLWRAQALQDMRRVGRAKFTRDRLEMAGKEKVPVAIWCFGRDAWEVGSVQKSRTYDVLFRPDLPTSVAADGGEPPEAAMIYKHDVKMACLPDALEAIQAVCGRDKRVIKEGLAASRDRKDRYRPADEKLLDVWRSGKHVRWIFRDGTTVLGKVRAFGRWDLDLEVEGGTRATASLFFHALHASTDRSL